MKIGVIGPSKLASLGEVNKDYRKIITSLAEQVVQGRHEIFLTPDKGSSSELFGQEYFRLGGKIFEVLPLDDKLGYGWVNTKFGKHINCGIWRNQPEKLNEETQAMICLGYGAGVLAEIAYSKWMNPKPIYIVKELVSGKLPSELNRSLNLKYVSYRRLNEFIQE